MELRSGSASNGCPDAYDVARALLTAKGPDDRAIAPSAISTIVSFCHEGDPAKLWVRLVDEAEHHGIAPLLAPTIAAVVGEAPDAVPDDIRRAFAALAIRHRRAALAREACVDRLLDAFSDAGIPIVLLKGTALVHRLYSAPELRPMADIDVLIDPADIDCAMEVARGLGYAFADRHVSRFAGRMHHLPEATAARSGFRISLEIHVDALSPNQKGSLTLATLAEAPVAFARGQGPQGMALGHLDMLRHLTRHAFEPARRVRLIHLYDLWRYRTVFYDEIDWQQMADRYPGVAIILDLMDCVFATSHTKGALQGPTPTGVGQGMMPLSEIAASNQGPLAKLAALFNPPAWWLHGFYAVPLCRSLFACRTLKHPVTVARWLVKRFAAGLVPPGAALKVSIHPASIAYRS